MTIATPDLTAAPAPSPADERSAEILARIRTAFARKGFDGTSMQDLARAAGISVGNFYRYFPSKTAIVEAMVAHDIAEIEGDFDRILQAEDTMAALRAGIARHLTTLDHDDCRLRAEISAAALRQSDVAATCGRMEDTVVERLIAIFARVTGLGAAETAQRFRPHARFIVLMVKAAAMRNDTSPDPGLHALILKSIDDVLSELEELSGKA